MVVAKDINELKRIEILNFERKKRKFMGTDFQAINFRENKGEFRKERERKYNSILKVLDDGSNKKLSQFK